MGVLTLIIKELPRKDRSRSPDILSHKQKPLQEEKVSKNENLTLLFDKSC